MSEFKLRQIEMTNGDRVWLLFGKDGIPDFDSTVFLINLYQEHKAPNTLKNIACAVRIVRDFEKSNRLSISRNIQNGKVLSRHQVGAVAAECGRYRGCLEKQNLNKNKVVKINAKRSRKQFGQVVNNSQRKRIYYANRYIEHLVERELELDRGSKELKLQIQLKAGKIKEIFSKLAPPEEEGNFDPERALPLETATKIMGLTRSPESILAKEIFKQKATRKRNMLIIELLLSTGTRVSEVAGLQISNICEEKQIVQFHDDKVARRADKRQNAPGFKTRGRPIKINKDLMQRLVNYCTARNGGRPRQAKHGFVFCANGRTAAALSLSSYYRIVRSLENAFGSDWPKTISPHTLRHTFFDIWFREANDKYNFRNNPALFDQVIHAAELTGGWRPDSKMILHYKQRYVFEQASDVALGTQDRMIYGRTKKV